MLNVDKKFIQSCFKEIKNCSAYANFFKINELCIKGLVGESSILISHKVI